jgi:hypothetical protein
MKHPMLDGHESDSGGPSNDNDKAQQGDTVLQEAMQTPSCAERRKRQKVMSSNDISLLKPLSTSQESQSFLQYSEGDLEKDMNHLAKALEQEGPTLACERGVTTLSESSPRGDKVTVAHPSIIVPPVPRRQHFDPDEITALEEMRNSSTNLPSSPKGS